MKTKDRYAMYLRKSRADVELEALGAGETLANHYERLMQLAERHEILPEQITVYKEIVSGESLQDRPEAQRLLSDVAARKYKGVLVTEVERLARGNTRDQGEVAEAFLYSSTYILTPLKTYDPRSETDEEYFEFGLFMSRREYKTTRRRLVSGKYQSAQSGNYLLPQKTFGYDAVRLSKKDRVLQIVPDEARIVQMIFDWFTEDRRPVGWIARQLTYMGIQTVRKRPEWSKETIKDMLKNPTYIGMIRYGVERNTKAVDPETGKVIRTVRKAGPDEQTIFPGKHKAIISDEQFEKAQSLMGKRSQPPVPLDKRIVNPLAGLIVCASCGKSMQWWNPKNMHNRVICYTHRSSTLCKKKALPAQLVLDGVVETLQLYIEEYEAMDNSSGQDDRMAKHQYELEAMERELATLERKRANLFDKYENEDYTREEFLERKMIYNDSIEKLKDNIHEKKANAPAAIDYAARIVSLHQMIDCIRNTELSAKAKNDFLKLHIDKVKYDVLDYGTGRGGKPILDIELK